MRDRSGRERQRDRGGRNIEREPQRKRGMVGERDRNRERERETGVRER